MKKDEIFTFTAPNGAEVVGVVINADWDDIHARNVYLCYAQNRLFTATTFNQWVDKMGQKVRVESSVDVKEVLVDYAILPDYDAALEDFYQHDKNVKAVQGFGYTKAEALNILEGKNADGSDFEELPF